MRKSYRRALLFCVAAGILLGLLTSGIFQQNPYYEPVPRHLYAGESTSGNTAMKEILLPLRTQYLFLPLPWINVAEKLDEMNREVNTDHVDNMVKKALSRLTVKERLAVIKIVVTRLNREDYNHFLLLMQGNVSLDEALDAYKILRERLTEDEMLLILRLVKKNREQLEELLRK